MWIKSPDSAPDFHWSENNKQKSTLNGGTTTEVYDYFRLLYARGGIAYSYVTGEKMVKYSEDQIVDLVLKEYEGKKLTCSLRWFVAVKAITRNCSSRFEKGYLHVRIDGEIREITYGLKIDRYKIHDIEVVIDKLLVSAKDRQRLKQIDAKAMQQEMALWWSLKRNKARFFSKMLMCPTSGISYDEPAPQFFLQLTAWRLPALQGIRVVNKIDMDKIIPDQQSEYLQRSHCPTGQTQKHYNFLADRSHTPKSTTAHLKQL